jgi:hypothetical protein
MGDLTVAEETVEGRLWGPMHVFTRLASVVQTIWVLPGDGGDGDGS